MTPSKKLGQVTQHKTAFVLQKRKPAPLWGTGFLYVDLCRIVLYAFCIIY